MTTFASSSLATSLGLSLWQVEMRRGQRGPLHAFDYEQVWTVATGEVSIRLDGETFVLEEGDTLVLKPWTPRPEPDNGPRQGPSLGLGL